MTIVKTYRVLNTVLHTISNIHLKLTFLFSERALFSERMKTQVIINMTEDFHFPFMAAIQVMTESVVEGACWVLGLCTIHHPLLLEAVVFSWGRIQSYEVYLLKVNTSESTLKHTLTAQI